MDAIKINLINAYKINNSEKDFIVYTLDKNNYVTSYILTNNLHRHYKQGENNFKLIDIFKQQIKIINIYK